MGKLVAYSGVGICSKQTPPSRVWSALLNDALLDTNAVPLGFRGFAAQVRCASLRRAAQVSSRCPVEMVTERNTAKIAVATFVVGFVAGAFAQRRLRKALKKWS